MTEEPNTLIWTIDDYLERSRDPRPRVRAWALRRLGEQHPLQALERAVEALGDEDSHPRLVAFEILHRWGDESLGPGVLAGLEDSSGNELNKRAWLLAEWGCEDAVEPLIAHMNSHSIDMDELGAFYHALSRLAPDLLGPWAKHQLDLDEVNDLGRRVLVDGLARCHIETDIPWMVDRWLAEPRFGGIGHAILQALRQAVGPAWLAETLSDAIGEGAASVARCIEEEEQVRLLLTEPELAEVLRASRAGEAGWAGDLLGLAQTLVEDLRLPVQAWRDGEERPVDYRWQVLSTLSLLEHLVSIEEELRARDAERLESLLALALAGLAGILADQDDVAWLEGRGDDRPAALVELLASPRERLPRQVERELADLGPSILPVLRENLVQRDPYWAAARAARVIEKLAAHHPQSCLPLADDLLDAVDRDEGDFIHEPAYRAVRLLGPAATDAVESKIRRDGDDYGELSDLLASFPTTRSAEVLHDLVLEEPDGPRDLRRAIASLASESSIDHLVQVGLDGLDDEHWAQALLDLCAIHDVSHPLEARWRKVVDQAEARRAEHRDGWNELIRATNRAAQHLGGDSTPSPGKPRRDPKKRARRKAQRQQRKKTRSKKQRKRKKRKKKR